MTKITRRALLAAAPLAALGGCAPPPLTAPLSAFDPNHASKEPAVINFFISGDIKLDIPALVLLRTMQTYVDNYLQPVWGVGAKLYWSKKPQPGVWNVAFVGGDQDDYTGTIAYHNFKTQLAGGLPYAVIDVTAALTYGYTVSIAATHELGEMLVNPGIGYWASPISFDLDPRDKPPAANSQLLALEIADPVERTDFQIDGVRCSNFVYPSYFEPWRETGRYDYLGVLLARQSVAPGGYQIVRDHDKITEVTGSKIKAGLRCYRASRLLGR